ncbi:radical SAM/SPASM domain-containing protein [Natranaerobius thermophilus]|uniref:Radical SAM domain protein n=1 Tax=Natranaerobius thermophilus (strain ATCC BAA-1301 / DSM 18059 / JW/NM-WN-LF) TaxID=457570 RepID=B2A0X4_NATTJ|nr:radical SAM protein [Natranaerobius thermophilus]ACB86003.1 Radical SAM domain protein [Natranaerobius thermophilus JW/NM-WN-LF]
MQASKYNFFFDSPDNTDELIAYNARTNALAIMDTKEYEKYKNYVENGLQIDDTELYKTLEENGFILENALNEIDLIRYSLLKHRYSTKRFGFTLVPTLECDFECIYCYEQGVQHGYMSEDIQQSIINYIKQKLDHIRDLSIGWHGGEPLLALDVIENINKQAIELCNEKGKKFSSSLITNGYNLNRETVDKLNQLNISSIQITLDGPKDIHDKRRPARGGQPTFSKIVQNLCDCKDILPNVSVRVNVDKENVERIQEVLTVLKSHSLENTVSVYPGYVEPTNDCYDVDNILDSRYFAKIEYEFYKKLVEFGFAPNIRHRYPRRRSNVCCADNDSAIVVDPEGDVYKCWNDVGRKEYKIAHVTEEDPATVQTLFRYMMYDPTEDTECVECKFLPLCMGGCPRRRIDGITDRCISYKYELSNYIKEIAIDMYNQKVKSQQEEKVKKAKI